MKANAIEIRCKNCKGLLLIKGPKYLNYEKGCKICTCDDPEEEFIFMKENIRHH